MTSLTISLLLPISGLVVSAVLVAVSRKKIQQQQQQDTAEVTPAKIDLSWLDEYEKKGKKKQQQRKVKAKKPAVPQQQVSAPASVDESSSSSSSEDDADDIQLLAAIQKNALASVKAAPRKPVKAVKPVHVSTESVEEEATLEEGWKAVPTKDELLIGSLRSRIAALGTSLEQAEAAKKEAERGLSAAQDRVQRLDTDLKERSAVFQLRLTGLEAELHSHRSHAQMLAKRVTILETQELSAAREEAERLAAIVAGAEARISGLLADKAALEASLLVAQLEAAQHLEEIAQLKASLESMGLLKSKHVSLEGDFAKLQQALFTTEGDLIALRSQEASRAAEHKRDLAEKLVADEAKEAAMQSLKQQVEELNGALETTTVELAEACTEKETLRAEMQAALEAAESSLSAAQEAGVQQLTGLQTELTAKESDLTSLRQHQGDLEAEIAALKETCAQIPLLQSTLAELEEQLADATQRLEEAQSAPAAAEPSEELETARSQIQAIKQAFSQHLSQTYGMKGRLQELEQENMQLSLELSALKATMYKQAIAGAEAEKGAKGKKGKAAKSVDAKSKAVEREASPAPSVASR